MRLQVVWELVEVVDVVVEVVVVDDSRVVEDSRVVCFVVEGLQRLAVTPEASASTAMRDLGNSILKVCKRVCMGCAYKRMDK